jgi:hypothetical protein
VTPLRSALPHLQTATIRRSLADLDAPAVDGRRHRTIVHAR